MGAGSCLRRSDTGRVNPPRSGGFQPRRVIQDPPRLDPHTPRGAHLPPPLPDAWVYSLPHAHLFSSQVSARLNPWATARHSSLPFICIAQPILAFICTGHSSASDSPSLTSPPYGSTLCLVRPSFICIAPPPSRSPVPLLA